MNIKGTIGMENHGKRVIYFNCPICGSFSKFVIWTNLDPWNDVFICSNKKCNSYYRVRISTSLKDRIYITLIFVQNHSEFLVKLRHQELI